MSRLLQTQLDKVEKELKKKEKTYQQELNDLRKENDRQQKLIGQVRKLLCLFIVCSVSINFRWRFDVTKKIRVGWFFPCLCLYFNS